MKGQGPKNLVASVHNRLLAHAQRGKDDPQLVLMRYGLERLLYRLSQSQHGSDFVLKGALLFLAWTGEPHRATKDVDLLALKSRSPENLEEIFREVCGLIVVEDGLQFLAGSVKANEIRENAVYQGVRVTIQARLGRARIPLQVDIGFGDVVTPHPVETIFPPLLNFPPPSLSMYPKETVVAEKLEAMVKLGIINSRMKDFYDVWALSQGFDFDGETLSRAIEATFKRRKTALPTSIPFALSAEFSADASKQRQWQAFIRRGRLRTFEGDLEKVVAVIREFLGPVLIAVVPGDYNKGRWQKRAWQLL